MLSSIKEFILDTIFSGKKRKRFETSSKNILQNITNKTTERKFYKLKSSGIRSIIKENIIDICDDKFIMNNNESKKITVSEILEMKIQISQTELEFHEKLNLFSKERNDIKNYPPIGISNFFKLIR
jgi:hypothetical protein